jgi:hypothetical protein
MAETIYCWRCAMDVPMLDDAEFDALNAILSDTDDPDRDQKALDFYVSITGFQETNLNAVAHHHIAIYGPPCPKCGRRLRTPRAKFCADCLSFAHE